MCAQFRKTVRKSGKGGPKRDFVYESFDEFVDKTSKTQRSKCLYCETVTSQNQKTVKKRSNALMMTTMTKQSSTNALMTTTM